MKTFLVVEQVIDESDVTYVVEADSMDEAVATLKAAALSGDDERWALGAHMLSRPAGKGVSVRVCEVVDYVSLPLKAWRAEREALRDARIAAAKEQDERDTLAKLQKKYGAAAPSSGKKK